MFGFFGDSSDGVIASGWFDKDGNQLSDGQGRRVDLVYYDDVIADSNDSLPCPV